MNSSMQFFINNLAATYANLNTNIEMEALDKENKAALVITSILNFCNPDSLRHCHVNTELNFWRVNNDELPKRFRLDQYRKYFPRKEVFWNIFIRWSGITMYIVQHTNTCRPGAERVLNSRHGTYKVSLSGALNLKAVRHNYLFIQFQQFMFPQKDII